MNTVVKHFSSFSKGTKINYEPIYSVQEIRKSTPLEVELYEDFNPGKPQPSHWLKGLLSDDYKEKYSSPTKVYVAKGTCLDMRFPVYPKDRIDLWVKNPNDPFLSRSKQITVSEADYEGDERYRLDLGDIMRRDENDCYMFALIREQGGSMIIISGI